MMTGITREERLHEFVLLVGGRNPRLESSSMEVVPSFGRSPARSAVLSANLMMTV